jgi:hypothetical protein
MTLNDRYGVLWTPISFSSLAFQLDDGLPHYFLHPNFAQRLPSMKRFKKQFFIFVLLLLMVGGLLHGQSYFYGGYSFAHYNTPEIAPQNYVTKFNLGWSLAQNSGVAAPVFKPDTISRRLENPAKWGAIASGITFGFVADMSSNVGIEMGFRRWTQTTSGRRTNLATNAEEKFWMQSRSGAVFINFIGTKSTRFMPYIGADFFLFKLRYSYESSDFDIKKQRIGTKGKYFFVAFNFGAHVQLLNFNDKASLRLVPQYQWHITPDELAIDQFNDLKFNHNNFSLGLILAIHP